MLDRENAVNEIIIQRVLTEDYAPHNAGFFFSGICFRELTTKMQLGFAALGVNQTELVLNADIAESVN